MVLSYFEQNLRLKEKWKLVPNNFLTVHSCNFSMRLYSYSISTYEVSCSTMDILLQTCPSPIRVFPNTNYILVLFFCATGPSIRFVIVYFLKAVFMNWIFFLYWRKICVLFFKNIFSLHYSHRIILFVFSTLHLGNAISW